ncbi:sigma-70 family RNA polymerase sigma factor [Nocardiopsis lucentensis]|uniref:sigma-70 family RNA polymerase sigma factor n=1 Tax=Nocardiopsis lucentensis TaxID=53441 RepID=UPI000347883F|nr:sigma-70 family RNA polymerase sigma factor [Nocardiopsis lucentensis]
MTDADGSHTELLTGDEEFIRRVRGGDTAAYGVLYERHAAAARGLARQLLRGEAEVEDAVAEAFTRVLSVIQRGQGPTDCFRPYLLTAVRNAAYDRGRGEKRQVVTDDMESLDPGQPFVDPALAGLERSLIARAFLSLPERWQAVLWHTEIEGVKPSEAAPILGMNANGVAALAYRAREGLRQAYLQMHLAGGGAAEPCRPTLGLLGAYVRGGLAKRDTAKVGAHLDECADCREVYAELMDVNVGLRGTILPLVAGAGAAGYLASVPGGAATGAWWGQMSRGQQQATVGATAAAGVAVAVAFALVSGQEPLPDPPTAAPPVQSAQPVPQDDPPPADPPPVNPPPVAPVTAPSPSEEPEPVPDPVPEVVPPADVPEAEVSGEEAPEPLFAAGIDPVGSLIPGGDGIMVMDVRNIGAATVDEVVALITLPPGVEMVSSGGAGNALPGAAGHGDWSCSAGSNGGRCVHPGLDAGQDSTQFFDVRVAGDADTGVPATVALSTGDVSATATGERGVSADGVAARYATAGRVRAETVGNALMTCVEPELPEPPVIPWPWPWPEHPHDHGHDHDGGQGHPDGHSEEAPGGDASEGPVPSPEADTRRAPSDEPLDPGLDPLLEEADGVGDNGDGGNGESSGDTGATEGDPSPVGGEVGGPVTADGGDGAPDTPGVPAPPVTSGDSRASQAPDSSEGQNGPADAESPEPTPHTGEEATESTAEGPCARARSREGYLLDNDHWSMGPLDRDRNPDTTSSSSATWELPEGGEVRWAGLYFSAAGRPQTPTARIKGPAADEYRTVTADEVHVADLPGYPVYQAFTDVTDIVRAHGGGEWWVADVPSVEGRGVYAGWSLVVVMEDPEVRSYNQAMVLDHADVVFRGGGAGFPVSGLLPAAVSSTVDVVAWEGDAGLAGDSVTVDGTVLAPHGGRAGADNAFVSSARGAVGDPAAFGTDVVRFDAVLGRESDIRIHSQQDALVVGVIALTAPMRT